jgi:cysteine-rich repeat protein
VEQCDDANAVNTDACVAAARRRCAATGSCGPGVEQCDDANAVNTDACVTGCKTAKCGDGFVQAGVEACDDGNMVDNDACSNTCKVPVAHADCGILTTMNMWGGVARGVDLRAWTGSTLHYLGCNNNGCATNTFYCTFDQNTQKLSFGATSGVVRAAVDPNNALGDTMPNSFNGCCSGPLGLCNGPDSNNNGVNINNAAALCSALGYQNGVVKREAFDNVCPQPHVLNAAGTQWTSDFLINGGYGSEWECTTFK